MRRIPQLWSILLLGALLLTISGLSLMAPVAQSAPAQKKASPAAVPQESQESNDKDVESVQSDLLELLRSSPKLTMAISADPTLLADEAYVNRNNPELAEFLRNHPKVVRNPEFYLFFPDKFPAKGGRQRFQAAVWPELQGFEPPNRVWYPGDTIPFVVFVLILGALLWVFRIVLESRKWNKLHKMQTDLFSKLLEKASTNEELLASFRNAEKPFFDLATIEPRSGNPLTRVFMLLQFGIVLTLAGGISFGFLYSRAGDPQVGDVRPFLGLAFLVFALGIGLIISSVASYFLARHLGLLPQPARPDETHARD